MGKQLDFERYFWFHQRLKENSFPSLKNLMDNYEILKQTAQRNITFMRDRLRAPIKYSRKEGGYYYLDKSYEFPKARFTEKEIMAMIIAECLAHTIPDKRMLEELDSLSEKFSLVTGINIHRLKKKISLKNIRYDIVDPSIFENTVDALTNDKKLRIEYKSNSNQGITTRTVSPLHLLLYKGNWHLLAFCEKRKALRNFSLSGILQIEILEDRIPDDLPVIDIEKLIEENYGIFIHNADTPKIEVSLKFSLNTAERVRKQVWFPLQNLEENEDGSITLTFPVTDFRELEFDILKYGPGVEVLKPMELREKMKQTIQKMSRLY